jgi:hypothetical protein
MALKDGNSLQLARVLPGHRALCIRAHRAPKPIAYQAPNRGQTTGHDAVSISMEKAVTVWGDMDYYL